MRERPWPRLGVSQKREGLNDLRDILAPVNISYIL